MCQSLDRILISHNTGSPILPSQNKKEAIFAGDKGRQPIGAIARSRSDPRRSDEGIGVAGRGRGGSVDPVVGPQVEGMPLRYRRHAHHRPPLVRRPRPRKPKAIHAAGISILICKLPQRTIESDGASYDAWCSDELPMLGQAGIGTAKLILAKRNLSLPSYSDSNKVADVLHPAHRPGEGSISDPTGVASALDR